MSIAAKQEALGNRGDGKSIRYDAIFTRFVHIDERAPQRVSAGNEERATWAEEKGVRRRCPYFANVFDARAAGVLQCWRLTKAVDTDGVSMHFKQLRGSAESVCNARAERKRKYEKMAAARSEARCAKAEDRQLIRPNKGHTKRSVAVSKTTTVLPKRDIWCIDALKGVSRDEYQVIGVDPGKHNIVQAVDSERRSARDGSVINSKSGVVTCARGSTLQRHSLVSQ